MAIRKRVVRRSKTLAKTTKRTAKRITAERSPKTATRHNRTAYWKSYRELQKKADKAWEKLRADVAKNARSEILIRDHNYLRLLLGECNYMARECMRIAARGKKRAPKKEDRARKTARR